MRRGGLNVLLVERDDLAAHTSSASTKLIHGGLRYLEYYEFRLVREALQERERLIHIAPHISWPLRFVLPQPKGGRPGWMIRIGLWLYDIGGAKPAVLARGGLGRSAMGGGPQARPGQGLCLFRTHGWMMRAWSCSTPWMRPRAGPRSGPASRPAPPGWRATIGRWTCPTRGRRARRLSPRFRCARAPWSMPPAHGWARCWGHSRCAGAGRHPSGQGQPYHRAALYPGDHAFILQKEDGRIVFTIPYQDAFTLVGTTDVLVGEEERDRPKISREEIDYLCETVNSYFEAQITPDDVVSTYRACARCMMTARCQGDHARLCAQTGARERPQVLDLWRQTDHLSPSGGTCAGNAGPVPAAHGRFVDGHGGLARWRSGKRDFAAFLESVSARWPFLPAATARRMAHAYGTPHGADHRCGPIHGRSGRVSAMASPRPSCAIW
jgi:glycerol-3-phosphate dehydrogenase